jgi:hypothetical protein
MQISVRNSNPTESHDIHRQPAQHEGGKDNGLSLPGKCKNGSNFQLLPCYHYLLAILNSVVLFPTLARNTQVITTGQLHPSKHWCCEMKRSSSLIGHPALSQLMLSSSFKETQMVVLVRAVHIRHIINDFSKDVF